MILQQNFMNNRSCDLFSPSKPIFITPANGTYDRYNSTTAHILHDLDGDEQTDYISIYRHLDRHEASDGAEVTRGQYIADSGCLYFKNGACQAPHLHLTVVRVVDEQYYTTDPYGWWNDEVDDPLRDWTGNDGLTNGGVESQWLWIDECPYTDSNRTFCDVPESNTFFNYIEQMATERFTNGCARYDPDGDGPQEEIVFFCPEHLLRRDHAMAFLGRAISGIDEPTDETWDNSFPDVTSKSQFYNWISYFADLEVVQGYSDGLFHPERYVTRGQWAKMIVGALEERGLACEYTDENKFQMELQDISGSVFYDDVWCLWGWMRQYRPDITIGYTDGNFRPNQEITRAQSSKWSMLGVELIPYAEQEESEGQNDEPDNTILELSCLAHIPFTCGFVNRSNQTIIESNTNQNSDNITLVVPWNDQDWVRLDLEITETLRFFTADNGINADIQLEIYDASTTNLLTSQEGLARDGGTILEWTPPAEGTYYLKVTNTFRYAREGTDLKLFIRPAVSNIYLPAVMSSSAGSLEPPDLIVTSLSITSMDSDSISYSYVIKNLGDSAANLDGPTDANDDNVSVQAFLSEDTVFNNNGDLPAGGTILGASPLGNLEPEQTFSGSFEASTSVDPASMNYLTLMVDWGEVVDESDETNNTIAVSIPETSSGDSYEPDNDAAQANVINHNTSQQHSIVPASDVDWMRFTLSGESGITLETSGNAGDTRLWLYDNNLSEIEFDDDSGSGLFSKVERSCSSEPLPSGTYYIKVDEYENDNEIDNYSIELSVTQCPTLFSFFDNFSDTSSGWPTINNSDYTAGYQSGEYEITIFGNTTEAWETNPIVGNIDYYAVADMRMYSGSPVRYGLVFDVLNSQNFYIFSVNPTSQQWSIEKIENGTRTTLDDGTSSTINLDNATNRLQVTVDGNSITAYINGIPMTTVSGGAFNSNNLRVGLVAKAGTNTVTARFDDFRVQEQ